MKLEITNNEYRQFVEVGRDSIAHKMIGGEHLTDAKTAISTSIGIIRLTGLQMLEDAQYVEEIILC